MRSCSVGRYAQLMSIEISPEDQILGRMYNIGPGDVYLLDVEDGPNADDSGGADTAQKRD